MKLVEEGRFVAFFPRVWEGGVLEEEFGADITGLPATVTVQDLLQHASGWISDPEDPMFPGLSNSPYWGHDDERANRLCAAQRGANVDAGPVVLIL